MYRDPVLQLFLKAVKGCGVDVVMLSTLNASARDTGVDSALFGSNVRERRIEWQTLASMLQRKFVSSETSAIAFATAHPFKAHDAKPLLPLLFPDLVRGYEWWGWVDWDTWVGDLRRLGSFLRSYRGDVWTPGMGLWKAWLPDRRCIGSASFKHPPPPGTMAGADDCAQKVSWGPLTVLRNSHAYTRLWSQPSNRRAVRFMLQQDGNTQFDEWGEVAFAHKERHGALKPVGYASSFSGILHRASQAGTLRLELDHVGTLNSDALACRSDPLSRPCLQPSRLRPGAGYCRMRVTAAGVTRLFQGALTANNASAKGCVCEHEAVVCHFPFKDGKRARWRQLDESDVRKLLHARDLVATRDHALGVYAV